MAASVANEMVASVAQPAPLEGREVITSTPSLAAPKKTEETVRPKRAAKKQSKEGSTAASSVGSKPAEGADTDTEKPEETTSLPAPKRQKKTKTSDSKEIPSEQPATTTKATTKDPAAQKKSSEMGCKEYAEGFIACWSKENGQSFSASAQEEFKAMMYREADKGGLRATKNNRKIVQPFDLGY